MNKEEAEENPLTRQLKPGAADADEQYSVR